MKSAALELKLDGRALGADCDNCPLNGRTVVPPTPATAGCRLVVVAESPGRNEEIEGAPLIGPSGFMLDRNLRTLKVSRSACHLTNAILCRPTQKMTPKEWKTALKCCRPRLEAELAKVEAPILAIGGKSLQTLTGKAKIMPWRGVQVPGLAPWEGRAITPTVHPAFIMRGKPQWEPVFRLDIKRALNPTKWTWPEIVIEEGTAMMIALRRLAHTRKPLGVDVETSGIDPMFSKLLCVGLANEDVAVSVPWPPQDPVVKEVVAAILADPDIEKVMHNGQHDLLTLKSHGLPVCGGLFDTLLAHATVAPQLPHDLGLVASCEFPAPRWKSIFRVESDLKGADAFTKRDPYELRDYNAKDATITAMLRRPLRQRLRSTHNGEALFNEYLQLSDLAMRMRERGLEVNRGVFDRHRVELTAAMEREGAAFAALGVPAELGANGMHRSLKKLFFDSFGIRPRHYSEKTGEPQLDAETLKQLTTHTDRLVSGAARAVLSFRQYGKLLSTYIDGLPIGPDGLVHPVWKVYGTLTGRWSSQDPNAQNIPPEMRDIFAAREGCRFVAADFSQLELRIVAELSQDPLLLKWYREGLDVHTENAKMVFETNEPTDAQRKLAKNVVYAMNYGGGADTIWRTLLPKFPRLTLRVVQQVIAMWFKTHPAIKEWQAQQVALANERLYVEAPVSGRREYFHSGHAEPTKALNYPIQSTAGDLMNRAILVLDKRIDWSREGIILQVHDEIVCEGPDPKRLAGLLREAMEAPINIGGQQVSFPLSAIEYGRDWFNMESLP